ncbi:MAG: hypothetical protein PHR77_01230 [Kiritimatiellae bacterium]|nr:hypothetical protein [Kiritimatiellia bacterium]MDD5522575.1 hypothetical protein [Kiritimatiellia bacterium]
MRIFLNTILVGLLFLSLELVSYSQIPQSLDSFEQTILDYKTKIDNCLNDISRKDATKEAKGNAAFSTSILLQAYEQFVKGIGSNQYPRLMADSELLSKLCSLHIAYAEYQLEDAGIESNPPSVTALEKALKEYQTAYTFLVLLNNNEKIIKNRKKIDEGLVKTIRGLNKYADWFAKDVFMNTEGKKWEANPAPQAEKLREELARRVGPLDEITICRKALERILRDIKEATERKDRITALEKMILGARWLTTILQKSPEVFVTEFKTYNAITRSAMEEVRKGYPPERMKEFTRFYEPLKSHYLILTSGKK